MKILVINTRGLIKAIGDQMSLEGDEVTISPMVPDQVTGFDLILTDKRIPSQDVPVIGGDEDLPFAVIKALGYFPVQGPTDFILTRWFDHANGWNDQVLVGFPLMGLMNEDLGPRVPTGIALRYSNSSQIRIPFDVPNLKNALEKMLHVGFVTIKYTLTPDSYNITGISTYAPYYSLFAILEGCPDKLSDFFINPTSLKESWIVSLLLTRTPFPYHLEPKRVFIKGLTSKVQKHFWTPYLSSHRNSNYLDNPLVGISSAWSMELTEANRRALRTCRAIQVEGKQFRTDLAANAQRKWAKLVKLNLVPSREEVRSREVSPT